MQLVGIEKTIKGKKKFLGKIGYSKQLKQAVYYRETTKGNAVLNVSKCLGYDVDAVDKAIELKADALATYCMDTNELLVTPIHLTQEPNIKCQDMGEELQYRLPMREPYVITMKGKLNLGWTNQTIKL